MKAVANVRRFPILRNRIVSINNISNPLARLLLTAKHCFGFGYLPLNSKYYHDVLPNNVNEVMLMITKQQTLKEKIVLMEHLNDLVGTQRSGHLTYHHRLTLVQQFKLWEGRSGRFQSIVSVAWLIKKLGFMKENKQLYDQIVRRVADDEWYVNLEESMKALETFADLEDLKTKEYIYPRIEQNIRKSNWDESIKTYSRICHWLYEAGRDKSQLWNFMEDYILRNLEMNYTPQMIADIFKSYALTYNGSHVFYQGIQKALYLGHERSNPIRQIFSGKTIRLGEFYALLVQTYSVAYHNIALHLTTDFLEFLYLGIGDNRTIYGSLTAINQIIEYLPGLSMDPLDEQQIITNLLKTKYPPSVKYNDIKRLYELMHPRSYCIPDEMKLFLEHHLLEGIRNHNYSPVTALQICDEMHQLKLLIDPVTFDKTVLSYITEHVQYLEGEQAKILARTLQQGLYLPHSVKQALLSCH